MEKNPIPDELRRSFDNVVLLIAKMTDEAADLRTKYGERSKIYRERVDQIHTLKAFYKGSSEYIEYLLHTMGKIGSEVIAADIYIMQRDHALGFRQACEVLGYKFSEEHIIKMDIVDNIIAEVTKPVEQWQSVKGS